MNRAEQSRNTSSLKEKAGVKSKSESYKPLRPSQILKSEKVVTNVINVLTEEYINPFDPIIDSSKLVNLSSGVPVNDCDICDIWSAGNTAFETFTNQRIYSNTVAFHDPIKRNKVTLFQQSTKSVTLQKNGATKTIEVNRNIIGKLLSISAKVSKPIDFEFTLGYPLSPVPLSLSNADGSRRVTQKSKLMEIMNTYISEKQ